MKLRVRELLDEMKEEVEVDDEDVISTGREIVKEERVRLEDELMTDPLSSNPLSREAIKRNGLE